MSWQPIETAPIGEYVLLRVPGRPPLVCIRDAITPEMWESYDAPLDYLRDPPSGWAPLPSVGEGKPQALPTASNTYDTEQMIAELCEIIEKHERGENHNEGAFDEDCDVCRLLEDLRAFAQAQGAAR